MFEELHLMEKVFGFWVTDLLEKFQFLVLVIPHYLVLVINNMTFKYQVKDQTNVLMIGLVRQKKLINSSKAKTKFG